MTKPDSSNPPGSFSSPLVPQYTEEEIFVMLEMQFGVPQGSSPRSTPDQVNEQHNDITEFLIAIVPDIVKALELRRKYYARYNTFAFDIVDMKEAELY